MNAGTADNAGTLKLKMLVMENIDMFRHPKYYKELRKLRNKSDQAISFGTASTDDAGVRPGPGQQQQASSSRDQASSNKLTKSQASSSKHQAPSTKAQA